MSTFKKSLSFILAAVMLLSVFVIAPISANADENILSDKTGDCTYTLNKDTGVLTIKGNGKMGSYDGRAPWAYENITKVVIEDGVTIIGYSCFADCTELVSVEISNTVQEIKPYAFKNCQKLKSIDIPDSVIYIDTEVFSNCASLSKVKMSNNINTIYSNAFLSCKSLKSISLPSSLKYINEHALGFYEQNSKFRVDGFTIYGYKNNVSFEYARKNGFKFVSLDSNDPFDPEKANDTYEFSCEAYNILNPLIYGKYKVGEEIKIQIKIMMYHYINANKIKLEISKGSKTKTFQYSYNQSRLGDVIKDSFTPTEPGTYTVSAYGATKFYGDYTFTVTGKKANTLSVKSSTKSLTVKALKKAKKTVKPLTIKKAKGTVKVVKVKSGTTAKIYKKITVNKKTGAITFKKGAYKKGTYKVKLKITAAGNKSYKSKSLTKTVKVKIK